MISRLKQLIPKWQTNKNEWFPSFCDQYEHFETNKMSKKQKRSERERLVEHCEHSGEEFRDLMMKI